MIIYVKTTHDCLKFRVNLGRTDKIEVRGQKAKKVFKEIQIGTCYPKMNSQI